MLLNETNYTKDLHIADIDKWLVLLSLKREVKMQDSKGPWNSCLPRLRSAGRKTSMSPSPLPLPSTLKSSVTSQGETESRPTQHTLTQ